MITPKTAAVFCGRLMAAGGESSDLPVGGEGSPVAAGGGLYLGRTLPRPRKGGGWPAEGGRPKTYGDAGAKVVGSWAPLLSQSDQTCSA